jgi:hypothetical protein
MNTLFAEQEKLTAAIDELSAAEKALAALLHEIEVVPRAEKTTISDGVRLAFTRLQSARRKLIELTEAP